MWILIQVKFYTGSINVCGVYSDIRQAWAAWCHHVGGGTENATRLLNYEDIEFIAEDDDAFSYKLAHLSI